LSSFWGPPPSTLSAINKYADILRIDEKIPGVQVKEKITEFIEKYKAQTINEVLFYFTGHGNFQGEEYYYLLSDFLNSKIKQTALENTELDNWLRSLDAKLAIKVVDACYAGVQYIKHPDALKNFFQKTYSMFNNCYFMFSSQSTETSAQDSNLSLFTESFLKSLVNYSGKIIRYKNITDYISDSFEGTAGQTPFFVSQAENTEKFGEISEDLKKRLQSELSPESDADIVIDQTQTIEEEPESIVDLVKKDAENYCAEEELIEQLEKLDQFCKEYAFSEVLKQLYDIEVNLYNNYSDEINNLSAIGEWLKKERDKGYFAKVAHSSEKYFKTIEVPKKRSLMNLGGVATAMMFPQYETKEVERYRQVISRIELTQEVPYSSIHLKSVPKFESLNSQCCHIIFIFSKAKIRFFYSNATYKQLNWNEKEIDYEMKWNTKKCSLKSIAEITEIVGNIFKEFEDYVMEPINQKYLPAPTEEE